MSALEIILAVLLILSSVILTVVILMQESRQAGLSGAIAGGADTFFGKNKGRTMEAKLSRFTKYFGLFFFVLALGATLLLLFFLNIKAVKRFLYEPLAQLAEHLTFNQGVRSSNLRWLTIHKTLKKLDVISFLGVLCFAFL